MAAKQNQGTKNIEAVAPNDAQLMRAIVAGDQNALATLYDRHVARLMGLAVTLLGNRSDAEDLLHDLFVEVWEDAARYLAEKSALSTWLRNRLRFRAIDRLRKLEVARRHFLKQKAETLSESTDQMPDSTHPEGGGQSQAIFNRMTAAYRDVLHLMYFRGLTCQEIAVQLGVPLGTVKSRLSGGLKQLRDGFGEAAE